ncbi:hypothetical protein [Marinoscillum sp.]|uniref:hypothetical protein n=1 Tax=Marinoscillum sp. TaxID=2024838 RepID=UPI003BACECF0
MKSLFSFIALICIIVLTYAQAPQKLSYQAVLRNSTNELIVSQQVGMRISILNGSATGSSVYSETISPTTNSFGLVSIEIGAANPSSFSAIDWSAGTYFIKTETDPNGGKNYTITATSQLLSVPYALYAESAGSVELTPDQVAALKGEQGLQGVAGATGAAGADGQDGASAYEVAVSNGFTGTEAEWLVSLNGTDGTDGAQGLQGETGATGVAGADGRDGASAYVVAVSNGFTGTESEWLASLQGSDGHYGASAYEVAVSNGFTGTEAQWLASLKGSDGTDGAHGLQGEAGATGDTGAAGADGQDGASAYEIAISNGFAGTESEWLASLEGADGATGAQGIQGLKGDRGDKGDTGADGSDGSDGASAYEIAVSNGFAGTESEWLASLEGADGEQGIQGLKGDKGDAGAAGKDGSDGVSAYEIAISNGFAGTESEWLASLEGADGASAYEVAVSNGFTGTEAQWLVSLKDDYTETDPEFAAWDKSTGIIITESQISDLQDYLTEYTETDPEFTAWDKSTGISIAGSQISDLQDYLHGSESDPDFNASPAASITSNDLVNLGNLSGTNTGDQDLSGIATISSVESLASDIAQLQSDLNALNFNGSETKVNEGDQISVTGEGTTESPYIISLDQNELAFQTITAISQLNFLTPPNIWRQVTDLSITIFLDEGADVFISYNVSAFAPAYYGNPYFATRLLIDNLDQAGMRVITSPYNASHCNNSISSIISLSSGTHTIKVEYRTNLVGDQSNNWPGNNDYQSRMLTVRELR